MADGNEEQEAILSALIAKQIETRRAAGAEISEEEEAAIYAGAKQFIEKDTLGGIRKAVDGGAAEEFKQINFLNGLPGAVAMIKSLVDAAGLSNGKKKAFWRRLALPMKAKLKDRGGLMFTFVDPDGRKSEFHLHGGECSADHDFSAEFDKVSNLTRTEKDAQRLRDQCSLMLYFTRQTYVRILDFNTQLFEELVLPGHADGVISEGSDLSNTTIFLQKTKNGGGEPVPLEPRVGLFFTKKQ